MSFLRLALVVAAVLYVALFAMNNMQDAKVDLVFAELGPMPMALIVLASVGVGASLASLVLAWPYMQGRVHQRRTSRRIEELEREIHGLRTLPLASDEPDRETRPRPEP